MTSRSAANVQSLFQAAQADGALSPAGAASIAIPDLGAQIQAGLGITVDDVEASEVFLVTQLIDDSGSIRFVAGNTEAVRDGHNGVLDALRGSREDGSILAAAHLLNDGIRYAYAPLAQAPKLDEHTFNPSGGTPLYERSLAVLATVLAKTQEFAANGVPVRSSTLIVTDGASTDLRVTAAQVRAVVQDLLRQECHIVAGMGISDGSTDFQQVFREMGIRDEWILTPKDTPSGIRHAFGAFSRSAVRASKTAASFSQTAVGGFASP